MQRLGRPNQVEALGLGHYVLDSSSAPPRERLKFGIGPRQLEAKSPYASIESSDFFDGRQGRIEKFEACLTTASGSNFNGRPGESRVKSLSATRTSRFRKNNKAFEKGLMPDIFSSAVRRRRRGAELK